MQLHVSSSWWLPVPAPCTCRPKHEVLSALTELFVRAAVAQFWININRGNKLAPRSWQFPPFPFLIQMSLVFLRVVGKIWASNVKAEMHQLGIFNFQLHSSGSFLVIMEAFSFLGRTLWHSTHWFLRIEALKLDCTTWEGTIELFRHQWIYSFQCKNSSRLCESITQCIRMNVFTR